MRKIITVIVFSLHFLMAQFHPLQWEPQSPTNGRIQLDHLPHWSFAGNDGGKDIALPFVMENSDTLYLENQFTIKIADSSANWDFVSHGFSGRARVQINGSNIAILPETFTKSRRSIPASLLHTGANKISITLSRPRTFNAGFLRFAHLFTEPALLGVTRPFYLQKQHEKLIRNFSYKIQFKKGAFRVAYGYELNTSLIDRLARKNGLTVDEFIGDKQVSHNLTGESRGINGKVVLSEKQLWSPENPVLVRVKIRLRRFGQILGQIIFRAGFKDVRMENRQLVLNAKPLPIRGVVYHQNLLSLTNRPILSVYRDDLKRIQKMGYNAVRFAAHIPDERMLGLCDSLGLIAFVEFPVINYPGKMFKRDDLLELISGASANIFASLTRHPSLMAIGLGNGTLTDIPAVQKFYYILKINMRKPAPVLTYLSPAPASAASTRARLTDFYTLFIRDDVRSYLPYLTSGNPVYALIASIGTPDGFYLEKNKDASTHISALRNDLSLLRKTTQIYGGFIDAYADWICSGPQQGVAKNGKHYVVADGMVTLDRQLKPGFSDGTTNPWQNRLSVDTALAPKHATNVFSLIMFFGIIFFFLFYRRYPRFKENFKRALQHPYGFFVDMRERRIIPVFNTLITGATSALILATLSASFIYYFNGSYRFQEILATISVNPLVHASVLKYSRSPQLLVIGLFVVIYLHPVIVGVFLKLISAFTHVRLRLRQAIGVGMWAGLPWVFLFPIVLAGYQILAHGGSLLYLAIMFGLFNFWAFYRLVNGIRILTLTRFRTVFMILLLSYILPIIIFLFFFKPHLNWLAYLNYLIQSAPLFNG